MNRNLEVGDVVFDDLTKSIATIVDITKTDDIARKCYWVDNDYLDGARYLWELTVIDIHNQ